jgi:hypothetical protein
MGVVTSRLGLHQGAQPTLPEGHGEAEDLMTEELETPIGLGINGLDLPQETQPAHSEGQGGADGFVTEEYTDAYEQQNETLEVLTDSVYTPEGDDEPPPASAFSSSSDESDGDADDEGAEEGDDEGKEEGDDEAANAANLKSQKTNHGLWEPQPYPAVLGFNGNETIYRPNIWDPYQPYKLHPDSDSDPEERKKMRKLFQERKVKPHRVVRPSPLRTASSPDSPVSPKKNASDDVGILPEPSPELQQDECLVSPLSDHELTPRPPNPTPPAYVVGHDWSEEDDDDDDDEVKKADWLKRAIASVTGSRRSSLDSLEQNQQIPGEDQTSADEGDEEIISQEPLSPVSPITPVSETGTETRMIVYSSNDVDETSNQPEASDYDTEYDRQTSQQTDTAPESFEQTDTAPESFDPVFVGAEEHDYSEKKKSQTSPDFFGPEPLTGLTPQEGIDAFWEWRERNRPAHRIFRTNREFDTHHT